MRMKPIKNWRRGIFYYKPPANFYNNFLCEIVNSMFDMNLDSPFDNDNGHEVGFGYINLSSSATVVQIGINIGAPYECWTPDGSYRSPKKSVIKIHLCASPFSYDELARACESIGFLETECKKSKTLLKASISIQTHDATNTIKKLNNLLVHLNKKNKQEEFSDQLIQELNLFILHPTVVQEIVDDVYNKKVKDSDFGDETENTPAHVNPYKKDDVSLLELLFTYRSKEIFPLNTFKKELVKGANPNQHLHGRSPLILVISKCPVLGDDITRKLTLLLLAYGANPLLRYTDDLHTCALDTARYLNNIEILNLIISAGSKPERSLQKTALHIKITHANKNNKKILSSFNYPGQRCIETVIESLAESNFTQGEHRSALRKLFFQGFNTLEKDFDEDFNGNDKIIESIYFANQLIGFNLIQKIQLENLIVINFLYAYISPDFRNSGLMPLLTRRIEFALQLLMPNEKMWHFFSACDYTSYGMIKKFPHFPKLNPGIDNPNIEFPIKKVLDKVYSGNYSFCRDVLTYCVSDLCKPKDLTIKNDTSFMKKFFEEFLHLFGSVTIAYPICFQVFLQLYETYEKTLGINFLNHIFMLGKHLQPLAEHHFGKLCEKEPVRGALFVCGITLFSTGERRLPQPNEKYPIQPSLIASL